MKQDFKAKTGLLIICKCGMCFEEIKDWVKHKNDTKRWREYHFNNTPYGIHRVYELNKKAKIKAVKR